MMSTGTASQTEIERLERNLSSYYGSKNRWANQEAHFDDRVEALNRVAAAIDINLAPLPSILDPVWAMHTTHTWEGNAATQSRTRLGIHEERASGAITTLRALVADLEAEAATAASEANYAAQRVRDYNWLIGQTQDDLREARRNA